MTRRRGVTQRVAATFKEDDIAEAMYDDDEYPGMTSSTQSAPAATQEDGGYTDDYGIDEDEDFQGPSGVRRTGLDSSASAPPRPRAAARAPPPSAPTWAMREDAVSITPDQRRAAVMDGDREGREAGGFGGGSGGNDYYNGGGGGGGAANAAGEGEGGGDRWNSAATEMRDRMEAGSGAAVGWANDDIIADGGQTWFENDEVGLHTLNGLYTLNSVDP